MEWKYVAWRQGREGNRMMQEFGHIRGENVTWIVRDHVYRGRRETAGRRTQRFRLALLGLWEQEKWLKGRKENRGGKISREKENKAKGGKAKIRKYPWIRLSPWFMHAVSRLQVGLLLFVVSHTVNKISILLYWKKPIAFVFTRAISFQLFTLLQAQVSEICSPCRARRETPYKFCVISKKNNTFQERIDKQDNPSAVSICVEK